MIDNTHPILRGWLSGSTCSAWLVKRSVLFENDAFIVLKHNAHSSYGDRFSGSSNCPAYAALYDKAELVRQCNPLGDGYMKKWEGRINKRQVQADCAAIGIEFQPT